MVQDIEAFYYVFHNSVIMFTIVFGYDRTSTTFKLCYWACIGDINGTHDSAFVPAVKAMSRRRRKNEII